MFSALLQTRRGPGLNHISRSQALHNYSDFKNWSKEHGTQCRGSFISSRCIDTALVLDVYPNKPSGKSSARHCQQGKIRIWCTLNYRNCFDRIHHDRLITRMGQRIKKCPLQTTIKIMSSLPVEVPCSSPALQAKSNSSPSHCA